MRDPWFVLLVDGAPHDTPRAAQAMVGYSPRLTRIDALQALRIGGGLVHVALARDEAQRCAGALSREGFGALAVPAQRLAWPPPPRILSTAAPRDEGLEVTTKPGTPSHLLPWRYVHGLRVARVQAGGGHDLHRLLLRPEVALAPEPEPPDLREELAHLGAEVVGEALSWILELPIAEVIGAVRHFASQQSTRPADDGLPLGPVSPPLSRVPEVWLELIGVEPRLRLRVRRGFFNYTALGGARALTSRANFATLLRSLLARLPHAVRDGWFEDALAQRLADNDPPEDALEEWQHDLAVLGLCTRLSLRRQGMG
jgi:hypothetical protein